jgi:hypothetical protein
MAASRERLLHFSDKRSLYKRFQRLVFKYLDREVPEALWRLWR